MVRLEQYFVNSARRFPERPALHIAGQVTSYRELQAAAQRIARTIGPPGPGEPDTCGIFAGKTRTGYAGVLGALLAGRTYVPLNLRFPAARNARMVQRSGVDTLVVDEAGRRQLDELLPLCERPLRIIQPDDSAASLLASTDPEPLEREWADGQADSPEGMQPNAYLLFTSGSTGVPKGVAIPHGCASRYVQSALSRYCPTPDDRFTQFFDLTFDLSVHDLFVCWGAGACLYAPPAEAAIIPGPFVREHELTFWFSVPSLAVQARRFHEAGSMTSLKWSLFCGEALPGNVAAAWQRLAPRSTIENLYGPTEATIAITAHRYDPVKDADWATVPIGHPLEEQEVCLLDGELRPVPDGEMAELFLGGSQLAPGYWQDVAATRQAFVDCQVPGKSSTRWYRTGDLASMRQDVGLIYHGRTDAQVKIRGFRVELSEIEAVVRSSGGVTEVAVVAWPLSAEGTALGVVAFGSGFTLPAQELRQHCARLLPDYMVPGAFRELPTLPRNANGKTDYACLRAMCSSAP